MSSQPASFDPGGVKPGPSRSRVLVDLSVAPSGGAATYAAGFSRGLVESADADLLPLVALVDQGWASEHPELVDGMRRVGVEVVAHRFPPPGTWAARLGRGHVVRRLVSAHHIEVAYFPRDAAPRLRIPTVVLVNNMYAWRSFGTGGAIGGRIPAFLLRVAARRTAQRAAGILAVSTQMAEAVVGGEVVSVIHHGCSLPEHPRAGLPRRAVPRVVLIGNLIENKGIETVMEGVARAVASGDQLDLRIYGRRMDPAYSDAVEALSHRLFGASVLAGPAYGPDLVTAYHEADILVVGGTFESFCYPLVEGMRSGCVVVAPAGALVAELCGDVAVTYPEHDPQGLAEALRQARVELDSRSARGVERSRRFTWEQTVAQTVAAIRAASGRPSGADPEKTRDNLRAGSS